ncbi:MAG: peptidylprolyl isomerase, partial [Bacteroidetes bacterium]|nr:peptidylprolyl isomerase [Bacteroidota bacterium]
SRAKGGELQWFGSGSPIRMVPEFEDAAFALQKDGDISKPVQSQFGWHIIKRLEKREMPSFADAKNDMKKKVERDTRSQVAKNKLIERIKKESAFAENLAAKAELSAKIDSTISKGNWKSDSLLKASSNKMLFSLAGKTYTQAHFLDYVEKVAKRRSDKNKEGLINEYYEGFVNQKALDYEESTLENKKPDFRNLMKEYRDGILLFELMDRQVWTKSVKDTTGLEEYRQKNATKYMWGDRADVVIYNVNDAKLAAAANKLAKKGTDAAAIKTKLNKADAKARISTIEGKYEKGQYDVVDKVKWEAGVTDVEKLNDSSYRFVVVKKIVGPEPKSLKEAKGYITSDYQEYLEKTWLASLRNKYPIVVDQAVFKSLIKK